MLYKNISDSAIGGVIKDIDIKTGTVTGYFSIFGNVDSDGDMIMPGAFSRTLNNNYKRLKHLNQHRPSEPLSGTKDGRLIVKEDAKGLFFQSTISQTSYGKDTLLLYQDGVLDEHSIGYEVVKSEKANGYNQLLELKLWEGSTVTWGANALAGTESVKSMNKEQCFSKMNEVLKAIKNGKYENEEIFEMLELYFKQLEQHINDLQTGETLAKMSSDPNIEFIDMMIPHHEAALKMVAKFEGKATDGELKTIMRNIKVSQANEISKMADIKNRLGTSPAPKALNPLDIDPIAIIGFIELQKQLY